MQHTQDQIEADAKALSAHRCPECNVDFRPFAKRAVQSHVEMEFPHGDLTEHLRTDYGRRFRSLMSYIDERFKGDR